MLTAPVVPAGRMSAAPQPTLTLDADLTVRPWHRTDAPAVAAAYADPDIQQWHARTLDEAEAGRWIAQRAERWSTESGADWAVTAGDTVVGRIALRMLELHEGLAEVAYWVVPAARGRGIAVRALRRVADWSFGELGLHRIELDHAVANTASCRVAAKAAFRYEGTKRQAVLHPDGHHDMHLHARLDTDPT